MEQIEGERKNVATREKEAHERVRENGVYEERRKEWSSEMKEERIEVCSIMSANMTHVPNDITYFCSVIWMRYINICTLCICIYIYIMKDSETESVKEKERERKR